LPPFDPTYEPPYEPPKISAIDPPLFRRRTPLSVEEKMEMSNNALIELAQSERLKRLEARYRELEELEHTLKPQGRELLEEVNHVGYDWIEKRREIEERNELFELRLRVMRSQDLRNELELQREMMFRDMRMPYPVPD